MPIHEQRNRRWRSYSIASMPDGGNVIELLISYLPGGAASEYLFNHTIEGDNLTLRGPHGMFTLPEQMEKDIYLICTGTGIAPFRSMVRYISHHSLPHGQLHLIFGCREKKDLLYADELREPGNT